MMKQYHIILASAVLYFRLWRLRPVLLWKFSLMSPGAYGYRLFKGIYLDWNAWATECIRLQFFWQFSTVFQSGFINCTYPPVVVL